MDKRLLYFEQNNEYRIPPKHTQGVTMLILARYP